MLNVECLGVNVEGLMLNVYVHGLIHRLLVWRRAFSKLLSIVVSLPCAFG